jgi:hypothetical protein
MNFEKAGDISSSAKVAELPITVKILWRPSCSRSATTVLDSPTVVLDSKESVLALERSILLAVQGGERGIDREPGPHVKSGKGD